MCKRTLIGWLLVLALFLVPGLVGCQAPASNSTAITDLTLLIQKQKEQMVADREASVKAYGELKGYVDQSKTKTEEDLARLGAGLQDATRRVTAMENSAAIANNYTDWRLRNLEDSRLASNNSGSTQTTFKPINQPSLPSPEPPHKTWGIVRIQNEMSTPQYVEVNGTGVWVQPSRGVNVDVPAGWATTRLVGYEAARNWQIGAPDYFQRVIITPKPADNLFASYR